MIEPTAIKSWEETPLSDRPRYRECLKRIMKRDQNAMHQMKKMTFGTMGQNLIQRFGFRNIVAVRASREHRVLLAPDGADFHLLAFAHRGDNRYYNHEA